MKTIVIVLIALSAIVLGGCSADPADNPWVQPTPAPRPTAAPAPPAPPAPPPGTKPSATVCPSDLKAVASAMGVKVVGNDPQGTLLATVPNYLEDISAQNHPTKRFKYNRILSGPRVTYEVPNGWTVDDEVGMNHPPNYKGQALIATFNCNPV